jgi:hypothetical protein
MLSAARSRPGGAAQIPTGPGAASLHEDRMDVDITAAHKPASQRPPLWHTQPQEADGPEMAAFTQAMKDDALAQEPIVELLAGLLDKTIERNDRLRRKSELVEFEAVKPCPLTASAYLKRIMKYGGCSPCCLVVGLVYLQRLKQRNPSVCLTSANMQRLLLVSVMVAAKFLDDLYYSNKHWSQIGGLNLQEVNKLELKILFQLGFSLSVSREEYEDYLRALGGVSPSDMVSVPSFNNVTDASSSFR